MENRTAAHGRRVDDLAPFDVIASTLTRSSLLILAVGLVAGALVWALTPAGGGGRATARLGLTEEVVWPFYDQVRDELTVAVDDPEFRDRLSESVGDGGYEIRVEAPIDQTYLDIVAEAGSTETATAAAGGAAELLVERARGTSLRSQQAQFDAIAEELGFVDERIATLRAAIDESFATDLALGESTDAGTSIRRQQLQAQRSGWSAELDELIRRRVQLDADSRELRRELDSAQPSAEIVRTATPSSTEGRTLGQPLVAGLGAAVLASIAVLVFDRLRGRVRGRWYVEGAGGVELLADLRDTTGPSERAPSESASELAARLDDAFQQTDDALLRGHVVGVVSSGTPNRGLAREVAKALLAVGHPATVAVPDQLSGFGAEPITSHTTIVPIDLELDRPEQHRRARSCAGLIVAVTEEDRVTDVRRMALRARELSAPLLGAALLGDPEAAAGEDGDVDLFAERTVDAPSV